MRRLNDGRTFEMIKVFYEPDRLRSTFAATEFEAEIHTTETHFLYGLGTRSRQKMHVRITIVVNFTMIANEER